MQHHACFALAGVNAVPVFAGIEQFIHVNQPRPHRRDRVHAELDAQLAANDLEQLRLTAVRVEKQYFADAGTMHAFAELEPDPRQRFVGQRQCARESEVLVGFADGHHRQHKRGVVGRHQFDRARDDTCIDRGIDPDRQMRAMLFDRTDRKDGHNAIRVDVGEVLRGQIPPPTRLKDHASSPAIRARPFETILAKFVRSLRIEHAKPSLESTLIRQARCLLGNTKPS